MSRKKRSCGLGPRDQGRRDKRRPFAFIFLQNFLSTKQDHKKSKLNFLFKLYRLQCFTRRFLNKLQLGENMDRSKYIEGRRELRRKFSELLSIWMAALWEQFKEASDCNKLSQQDKNWEVRIRKNAYLHIRRTKRVQLYVMACNSRVVRNPSAFVEKTLARIDAHDREAKSFPMTALDWLEI